jgi:mannosyltransferase
MQDPVGGPVDLAAVEVIAPSFKRRFSGVVATVIALVPAQAKHVGIRALGPLLPDNVPQVSWRDFWRGAWRRPKGRPWRIWHARRDNEMMLGIVLRDVLRQPVRLLFTSAAQKRHKWFLRFLIARMDAIIATSPQAASYLDRPSTVIMHGVDTERFARHPTARRPGARPACRATTASACSAGSATRRGRTCSSRPWPNCCRAIRAGPR